MPREPVNTAQLKFRIHKRLRAKLEFAAQRRHLTLNSEVTRRLEASFDDEIRGDFATIAQNLDLLITQLETAWMRLEATREVLVLGDLLTTKIINHGERHEWVKDLTWPAQEWRRLRATVDQPLREPGPGVRLQEKSKP
jgi:hypothetical protein